MNINSEQKMLHHSSKGLEGRAGSGVGWGGWGVEGVRGWNGGGAYVKT